MVARQVQPQFELLALQFDGGDLEHSIHLRIHLKGAIVAGHFRLHTEAKSRALEEEAVGEQVTVHRDIHMARVGWFAHTFGWHLQLQDALVSIRGTRNEVCFKAIAVALRTQRRLATQVVEHSLRKQDPTAWRTELRKVRVDALKKALYIRELAEDQDVVRKSSQVRHAALLAIDVA